jgi:hypothetical protein
MILKVERGTYQDGIPCCSNSLLNKGKLLERQPGSEHDFGFLDFDAKWFFTGGFEAPMGVINHRKVALKHQDDEKWFSLSNKEHYFKNNQLHYPLCCKDSIFTVMSLKPNDENPDKDWDYFLWIIKHNDKNWKVVKVVELEEWFRPLQFTQDESMLVVWGYLHVSIINLTTYEVRTLINPPTNEEFFTNAHLSSDYNFVLAVSLEKESILKYYVTDLSGTEVICLMKGENEVSMSNLNIPTKLEFPLLVDRGSDLITITKK